MRRRHETLTCEWCGVDVEVAPGESPKAWLQVEENINLEPSDHSLFLKTRQEMDVCSLQCRDAVSEACEQAKLEFVAYVDSRCPRRRS